MMTRACLSVVLHVLLALTMALGGRASAAAEEIPVERQVLILTRALAYDGDLKSRAGGDLVIAVLSKAGDGNSQRLAGRMTRAFQALSNVKVQGLSVRTIELSYSTPAALLSVVEGNGIDALYLCTGLDADLPAIIEITRKRRVISMASVPEQVQKGIALGVFPIDKKPTILVNLPASRAEGAAFSSDLLRLAKVLR